MIEFAYAATTPGNTPAAGGGMSSIVLIVLMVAIFSVSYTHLTLPTICSV